jgi:hypothetical protein
MSDNVNISFIPKQPIARGGGLRNRPLFGISFLIAVTITFCIIGYATFQYFQIQTLEADRQAKIGELIKYKQELEDDKIIKELDDLRNTANEIDQAKKLLNSHVALTDLFDYIGNLAPDTIIIDGEKRSYIDPIVFNSFSMVKGQDGIVVTMNGSASSYGTLAALTQYYREKKESSDVLKDFAISGFSPMSDNRYSVNLVATLDQRLISYGCVYGDEATRASAGCVADEIFDDMNTESLSVQEGVEEVDAPDEGEES